MRKYIVMDFNEWHGLLEGLAEGKKYYLTENERSLIDDDGGIRPLELWNGNIEEDYNYIKNIE